MKKVLFPILVGSMVLGIAGWVSAVDVSVSVTMADRAEITASSDNSINFGVDATGNMISDGADQTASFGIKFNKNSDVTLVIQGVTPDVKTTNIEEANAIKALLNFQYSTDNITYAAMDETNQVVTYTWSYPGEGNLYIKASYDNAVWQNYAAGNHSGKIVATIATK